MDRRLPKDYSSRSEPENNRDRPSDRSEAAPQTEAYEVVRYLLGATGRGTVIDIGCRSPRDACELPARRLIGVDCGPNLDFCRTNFGDSGEWIEADFSKPTARLIANHASSDAIVICADLIEQVPDPSELLHLLHDCYRRGAIVITTTPDRIGVKGADHDGPPPDQARVREWELTEYARVIADAGLGLTFAGYTINKAKAWELNTILTLSDPDVSSYALPRNAQRPLAIIAAYNEADILDEVIGDWLAQGCDVHLIDNWSTDETWQTVQRWATTHPARVTIERFPDSPSSTYEWVPILHRKADIAARHPGRWILHTDADEIRRSPFPGLNLADSLDMVAHTGANRVDFRVINFRPISEGEATEGIQRRLLWFDFGTRPGHLRQAKAWLQGRARVDLASTGGHEALFETANDFRYKFLLKHYPLRSEAHARRKIEQERRARRSPYEYSVLNFHGHYDALANSGFKFESKADLIEWSDETFWRDHGLLIMTDLLRSRVESGLMAGGK